MRRSGRTDLIAVIFALAAVIFALAAGKSARENPEVTTIGQ
jgi:hypothetical protein